MEASDFEFEMAEGYVIGDAGPHGSLYGVSRGGRYVGEFPEMSDVIKWIAADMNKSRYWPGVFYVNDHGNVSLLSIFRRGRGYSYRTVESWV